jgi:3-hydroxybutyryl-CoA dehydratase
MIKREISDIQVGDFSEIKKKMNLKMVRNFALISNDFNPIHLDKDYASKSRYKKQIIHGLMATSLFSGLFGTSLPGEGCVYKSQNIRFKRAIYINDLVTARVEVESVDVKRKIIIFQTVCLVNNKIMIDGHAEIFMP